MAMKQPSTDAQAQPDDAVAAQQAYLAVARHLLRLERSACGLWPMPADMGLDGPSRRLAAALAVLGHNVGLVAPRSRWREDVSHTERPLSLSPASEGFDVLTPEWPRGTDAGAVIERTLALTHDRYGRVLFDLSGLDILGVDQSAIVPGLDVVLLVASGRTNEFALARVKRRLPPERILGVVLVDMPVSKSASLERGGLHSAPSQQSPSERPQP
jgi:hypothetical protein